MPSVESVSQKAASLGFRCFVENFGRNFGDVTNPATCDVLIAQATVTVNTELGLVEGAKQELVARQRG